MLDLRFQLIMESEYARGLNLLVEDREPSNYQGVNGVGTGATQ